MEGGGEVCIHGSEGVGNDVFCFLKDYLKRVRSQKNTKNQLRFVFPSLTEPDFSFDLPRIIKLSIFLGNQTVHI